MNPYLLIGIRFSKLIQLLSRNKVSVKPIHLFKLLILFQNSFWSSLFAHIEKMKYKSQLEKIDIPEEMLIIVGHWRTGSTYLHNLLSQDENFATPTLLQTAYPDSFLFSEKYISPIMNIFLSKHRPMDLVELGCNLPQEDEYALVRMSPDTPLERLIFPKDNKYFLQPDNLEDTGQWQESLTTFCKKIHIKHKKYILLKNPFHSFRIKELSEMYPQAKFICIHRHPFAVIPSTIKLWDFVGHDNNLNRNFTTPDISEVADIFGKLYEKVATDFKEIDTGKYCHVKYEDIEADPVKSVKQIYHDLGYEFSGNFENNLKMYVESIGTYQKNEFNLTEEQKQIIQTPLKDYMSNYGYFS